jgi:glutamine synthetase
MSVSTKRIFYLWAFLTVISSLYNQLLNREGREIVKKTSHVKHHMYRCGFLIILAFCMSIGLVSGGRYCPSAHWALRPASSQQNQDTTLVVSPDNPMMRDPTLAELREGSGIELTDYVPVEERVQFITVSLEPSIPVAVDHEALMRMAQHNPQHYTALIAQMRALLHTIGHNDITEDSPAATVIGRFAWFTGMRVREAMTAFAAQYQLDPHAQIVIEWGSRRPAHFHLKGRYQHKIILNINLFLDPTLLQAESFHEVLHPLVKNWLTYAHVEFPELFAAAGITARTGIPQETPRGNFAVVWQWDFERDEAALLREFTRAMHESGIPYFTARAQNYYRMGRRLVAESIRLLSDSQDEESREVAEQLKPIARSLRTGISPENIDTLEEVMRRSIDALDISTNIECRARAQAVKDSLRASVRDTIQKGRRYESVPEMREMFDRAENTLRGRAMIDALAEVFILTEELAFIDASPRRTQVLGVLRDNANVLDREKRFARLLTSRGDARLRAVIAHVSNPDIYHSRPDLAEGAALLGQVWDGAPERPGNPELIKRVLRSLHADVEDLSVVSLTPPADMNEAVQRLVDHDTAMIEVVFTDPEGRLQGQRKTVLMPISGATLGILVSGVGFDGSSIHSSIDGAPLKPIFESDFVARFDPHSLQIFTRDGKRIARLRAQATLPLANIPHEVSDERKGAFMAKFGQHIGRPVPAGLPRAQAQEAALHALSRLGISQVRLFISDWSEEFTMATVTRDEIPQAFDSGIDLTAEQTQFLPVLAQEGQPDPRQDLRAIPDPHSLMFVEYPDGEVEAIMNVKIIDAAGVAFCGDFRTQLQKKVEEVRHRFGLRANFSPEPEFFLLRELEDGTLVTADVAGYYSDLRSVPHDVRDFLDDVAVTLTNVGFGVRYIHHEVAPGQYEIPYEHGEALEVADRTTLYMYLIDKIAHKHGLIACFMPKPVDGVNGSGMHIHQSLAATAHMTIEHVTYEEGDNVFFDPSPSAQFHLSPTARHYMGGLLRYAPAFQRFTNPDSNSYRRLVPHFEAPTYNNTWSSRNRSCLGRVPDFDVPADGSNAPAARMEIRLPDACGNVYAKFLALLTAGIRGIDEGIEPPAPIEEENVFEMSEEELAARGITQLAGGPAGLETAVARMNDPAMEAFVSELAGGPESPVRRFLSEPEPVFYPLRLVVSQRQDIIGVAAPQDAVAEHDAPGAGASA